MCFQGHHFDISAAFLSGSETHANCLPYLCHLRAADGSLRGYQEAVRVLPCRGGKRLGDAVLHHFTSRSVVAGMTVGIFHTRHSLVT